MDDALIETFADAVHEAWMETKRAQGITTRQSEWGDEMMVPYAELPERTKDLDRATVRSVLAAIDRSDHVVIPLDRYVELVG